MESSEAGAALSGPWSRRAERVSPGGRALGAGSRAPAPSRAAQAWAAQGGAAGGRAGGEGPARRCRPRGTRDGEERRPHPALERNGPGVARRRLPAGRRLEPPTNTDTQPRPGSCALSPPSAPQLSLRSGSQRPSPPAPRSQRPGRPAEERPRHPCASRSGPRLWPRLRSPPPAPSRWSSLMPWRCVAL